MTDCTCPVEVWGDVDDLPRPMPGVDVRNFEGACLDDTGGWLYATMRGSNAPGSPYPSTTWLIARWPYPGLDSYEVVVETTGGVYVHHPHVLGDDLYWIANLEVRTRQVSGTGTGTVVADLEDPAIASFDQNYWGIVRSGGNLWVPYHQLYGAGVARSGLFEIDPDTLAVTDHLFRDGPQFGPDGHLTGFRDICVANDGAIWAVFHQNAGDGYDGLARFDPAIGTWMTTDTSTYSLEVAAPFGNAGKVRSSDWAPDLPEVVVVSPDMSIVADECGATTEANMPHEWVAVTPDYTTILFKEPGDALMAMTCIASGWRVGSIGFG